MIALWRLKIAQNHVKKSQIRLIVFVIWLRQMTLFVIATTGQLIIAVIIALQSIMLAREKNLAIVLASMQTLVLIWILTLLAVIVPIIRTRTK